MDKKQIAQKMVQHTHYDRKLGKLVKTMIPQTKEHAERSKMISHHISSYKEPNSKEKSEHQKNIGRAYND